MNIHGSRAEGRAISMWNATISGSGRHAMHRRVISFFVLVSLVPYLGACSSMRYVSPQELSEVEHKSSVWVTLTDGTRYEVKEPKIMGSKLIGFIEPEGYREIDSSEIEWLGLRELDKTKTAAVGLFGVAAVVVLICMMSRGDENGGPCYT